MASKPISELVELVSPQASDILAIVNSFETKKIQLSNLISYLSPTEISNTDSPYSQQAADNVIYCDTSAGDITVNLLAVSEGKVITIKNIGSGVVTIDGNGAELVETDTTLELAQYDSATLHATSTQWWVI